MGIQTEVAEHEVSNVPQVTLSTDDLVAELRRILRKGLPAGVQAAGDRLPHLRSVVARASHPDDLLSRIDALNDLLPKVMDQIADERTAKAARILFGVAAGSSGTTWTLRRERCAALLEYDVDHFRKRVEARILLAVAEALRRDLVGYRARLRRATNAYEIGRPTPTLTREELNREDELLSRIWQRLYEVRAETIATHLAEATSEAEQSRGRAQLAARELQDLVDDYVQRYGRQLIRNGQLEYAIDGIERLVIWKVGS